MTPLRQILMDAVLQRGYSIGNYVSYAGAVKQLIKFHHRPPDQISLCELQPFFEYLVKESKLAPATCHGYLAGIHFFYEKVLGWPPFEVPVIVPKRTQRFPELLTRSEMASNIDPLSNLKHRTMLQTCYGCGLRLTDPVSIKVRLIDCKRHLLRVEQGKGAKYRAGIMPDALLLALRVYLQSFRPQHWLFEGQKFNRHRTDDAIRRVFTAAKINAGIEKVGGIRSLRLCHSSA